jgi:hypothetical protein
MIIILSRLCAVLLLVIIISHLIFLFRDNNNILNVNDSNTMYAMCGIMI